MQSLNTTTNDVIGAAASEDQTVDEYRRYIEDHLKNSVTECPSFCSLLWYVFY